jgi:hypothetical protein
MIRKSYAALRNLITSLLNPNPMLSGQVESESDKTSSDPHHCFFWQHSLLLDPANGIVVSEKEETFAALMHASLSVVSVVTAV